MPQSQMISRGLSAGYSEEELERAILAVRVKMTRNGLEHSDRIDIRTGTILKPYGLVQDREPRETLPDDDVVVAVINDPNHVTRIKSPPGPIICHLEGDGTQRVVTFPQDLLLNEDAATRNAAIGHFERLEGLIEPVLTPRSEFAISRCEAGIKSDDPNVWRPAAIEVFDAVRDDFLLNLAGFRQSGHLRYQEGMNTFGGTLLRPTLTSIESIQIEVATPRGERGGILKVISECAASSTGFEDACDTYYRRLGHLPLDASLGIGQAVNRWTGSMSNDELWAAVWRWAERWPGPLPRFHACQFFVVNAALVPDRERPQLWKELREILSILVDTHEGIRWHEEWNLMCDLARHYAYFLECQLPGIESERIANLSWWLSAKVASAFGSGPGYLELIRTKTLAPELNASAHIWKIVHTQVAPSSFRVATLLLPSVWAQALLCVAADRLKELVECGIIPRNSEEVKRVLTVSLVGGFSSAERGELEPVYGFDRSLTNAGDVWLDRYEGDEETKTIFQETLSYYRSSSQPAAIREWLEQLPVAPVRAQTAIVLLIKTRSFAGELPDDLAWELATNPDWFLHLMRQHDPYVIEALLDALIEHQVQRGGRWKSTLPHLVASALLAPVCERERRRLLFGFCIICSISSGTVSALDRVFQSDARLDLEADIMLWCRRLVGLFNSGLPWVQARVRPVLASLSRQVSHLPNGTPANSHDPNVQGSLEEVHREDQSTDEHREA